MVDCHIFSLTVWWHWGFNFNYCQDGGALSYK